MKWFTLLSVAVVLQWSSLPSMATSGGTSMPAWGNLQGNVRHTGYVPGEIDIASIELLWDQRVGDLYLSHILGIGNPIAIGGGQVYVRKEHALSGPNLFVFDAATGVEDWTFESSGIISPVTYEAGKVYLQDVGIAVEGTPMLYVLDSNDGSVLQTQVTGYRNFWEPGPVVSEGVVYVDNGDNRNEELSRWENEILRYDVENDVVEWSAHVPQQFATGTVLTIGEEHVYAWADEGTIYAIDKLTGEEVFQIADLNHTALGFGFNGLSLFDDGAILGTNAGRMVRFNTETQAIDWEVNQDIANQPVIVGDDIYAISSERLAIYDVTTGERRRLDRGNPINRIGDIIGEMIATDSHLFLQTLTQTYAFNFATQTIGWSFAASGSLSLGEGLLVIGDSSPLGDVYAFSIATVPEPSSLGLVLLALVSVSARRQRTLSTVA